MITQETIEEVKKRLVDVYKPLKIYIFGSYAWGTPNEDSDLDIFIVIEKSDARHHLRGKEGYMALWGLYISKDLLVYTKDEFEEKAADPTSFISKIIRDGKVLYVKP